jgi:signal transduction histidine kinase
MTLKPSSAHGHRSTRVMGEFLDSYRVRLVLAFALVVTVALGLVLTTLPRLLDNYFRDQDMESLQTRADSVAQLVGGQLLLYQTIDTLSPHMILTPGLKASDTVLRALGNPDLGFVRNITDQIAEADVVITIAASVDSQPVYTLTLPVSEQPAASQAREPITASSSVQINDRYYSASVSGGPARLITATLSNPYTTRAQTIQTIASVMLTAAVLALLVTIVAAVLLAQWLTQPIRRLTQASRSLAEGKLDARVPVPTSASPEVAELARSFNNMADRLQESIQLVSGDRDRSRDFLADVSHELRTPIAALRTFNELLQDGAAADPATREEFLEQSARQIERLDWLSTNLLELSKLDSGLIALDLRPDDLRAVVENAVEQAEPLAKRKSLELILHVPPEPVRQPHDPMRIGQVLSNLIGNAIKFTPAGGRVDVEMRSTAEGAEISVSDTGVGIDADELPHIFDRFYRGSRTPQERGAGSGLGLSIAKSITDMHHGRISVQTSADAGTRVVVTLPRDVSISSPTRARS